MKYQPVIDTKYYFNINDYTFRIEFYKCNDDQKSYGLYNIRLLMEGEDISKKLEEIQKFSPQTRKQLLKALGNTIEAWCQYHPNQFLTFFDCLSAFYIPKLFIHYFRFGFTCDGRGETWFTFIDDNGRRTKFKNMLNLLDDEDLLTNDIWRACKDDDYYDDDLNAL